MNYACMQRSVITLIDFYYVCNAISSSLSVSLLILNFTLQIDSTVQNNVSHTRIHILLEMALDHTLSDSTSLRVSQTLGKIPFCTQQHFIGKGFFAVCFSFGHLAKTFGCLDC